MSADLARQTELRLANPAVAKLLWSYLTEAERTFLGNNLPAAYARGGAVGMWTDIKRVTRERAIAEVAEQVGFLNSKEFSRLLSYYGEDFNCTEDGIQRAARTFDLVHVEHPRELYWLGEQVRVKWYARNKQWDYVTELIYATKLGQIFDHTNMSSRDADALSKFKSRLCNDGLPTSLGDKILAAGRGSQRLTVRPDQIYCIRRDE